MYKCPSVKRTLWDCMHNLVVKATASVSGEPIRGGGLSACKQVKQPAVRLSITLANLPAACIQLLCKSRHCFCYKDVTMEALLELDSFLETVALRDDVLASACSPVLVKELMLFQTCSSNHFHGPWFSFQSGVCVGFRKGHLVSNLVDGGSSLVPLIDSVSSSLPLPACPIVPLAFHCCFNFSGSL